MLRAGDTNAPFLHSSILTPIPLISRWTIASDNISEYAGSTVSTISRIDKALVKILKQNKVLVHIIKERNGSKIEKDMYVTVFV